MEVQQVVKKIGADAKAEAEKIAKAAGEKEAAEKAELDEQLKEYRAQSADLAKKAGEDEKSHILAAARMENSKSYLAEKRQILEEVFERARQQLQSLADDDYRGLMSKLMLAAVETGEEEVLLDTNEGRIDQALIDGVNKQLASSGKGALKLSEERLAIGGGFVLRRGKIKNNVSFGVLLDEARKELEIDLARDLFS